MKKIPKRRRLPAALTALGVIALIVLVPTASGAAPPSIAWSPTTSSGTFDYGAVTLGQTASQTFTLTNSGGSSTGMLTVSLSGSSAFAKTADACTDTSLGKGKSCAVTVRYAATPTGQTDSATLTATGKKAPASASIALTGKGAGRADLRLSPGTFLGTTSSGTNNYFYDFGPVASASQIFTVINSGNAASSPLRVVGGGLGFFVSNISCDQVLLPGLTCFFSILATAPGGCSNAFGPVPVEVFGLTEHYINLSVLGHCPP